MPPPDRAVLATEARRLGADLDEGQVDRLIDYLQLLQKWNRVFNLTAIRDPAQALTHHLLDCLAIVAPLRRHGAATLLDVGSGAGLPGLVLAVALPGVRVTCVDSVAKKAAFLTQAAAELQLTNAQAVHARVEGMQGGFDVVTSRALASLADFTRLTRHLLDRDGVWLAMKGKRPDDEIAALPPTVELFHVEQLDAGALHAERCIVWMKPTP
jgi:16S rRNA (guanine527-N7)-methyltransferase